MNRAPNKNPSLKNRLTKALLSPEPHSRSTSKENVKKAGKRRHSTSKSLTAERETPTVVISAGDFSCFSPQPPSRLILTDSSNLKTPSVCHSTNLVGTTARQETLIMNEIAQNKRKHALLSRTFRGLQGNTNETHMDEPININTVKWQANSLTKLITEEPEQIQPKLMYRTDPTTPAAAVHMTESLNNILSGSLSISVRTMPHI